MLQHNERAVSLKEHLSLSKDAFPPVRSWMRLLTGSGLWSDHCLTCLGIKHAVNRCIGGLAVFEIGRLSPQECVYPSEPSCTDTVQSQGERGAGLARCTLLAQPDLVPRADAPCDSTSLMYSSEEGSTFSVTKHPVALASGSLETPCLVPGWDTEVLGDPPQDVADTFTLEQALSMRLTYALKWNQYVEWCSSHREDPEDQSHAFLSAARVGAKAVSLHP